MLVKFCSLIFELFFPRGSLYFVMMSYPVVQAGLALTMQTQLGSNLWWFSFLPLSLPSSANTPSTVSFACICVCPSHLCARYVCLYKHPCPHLLVLRPEAGIGCLPLKPPLDFLRQGTARVNGRKSGTTFTAQLLPVCGQCVLYREPTLSFIPLIFL